VANSRVYRYSFKHTLFKDIKFQRLKASVFTNNLEKKCQCFFSLRISYFVIWDIVRRPCSRIYSDALDLTRLCPLKSSDRMSVSRREGGNITNFNLLRNEFYQVRPFQYLQYLQEKNHCIP
jgi:hypothetical protein